MSTATQEHRRGRFDVSLAFVCPPAALGRHTGCTCGVACMSIVWICTLFCYVIAGILQSDPAKKKDSKLGLLVAFVGALVNLPNAIVALVGIASLEEPVPGTQGQTTDD